MLSFGIIIPVLPKLVEEFLGGDTPMAAEIYGLMGTAWALMQFVCSPIQGRCPIDLVDARSCCCRIWDWPRFHSDGAGALVCRGCLPGG